MAFFFAGENASLEDKQCVATLNEAEIRTKTHDKEFTTQETIDGQLLKIYLSKDKRAKVSSDPVISNFSLIFVLITFVKCLPLPHGIDTYIFIYCRPVPLSTF